MPIAPKPHSALLIVGHGSTENPASTAPYFLHADAIRRRTLFAEVHCCFWKEEPSLRDALYLIDSPEVYVVPAFISEGYFTQNIIPRELRLSGPSTLVHGKSFHYCLPVGNHPSMTRLILHRAKQVAPHLDPASTTLIITGHGTPLNPNSALAIRRQVDLIRSAATPYAAVLAAYMEEPPFIADWHQLAPTPHVIVVPFFITDGPHSFLDIPSLLGIQTPPPSPSRPPQTLPFNPHLLHQKILYYSSAIGTEPLLAEVILDQVADFDRTHKPLIMNNSQP